MEGGTRSSIWLMHSTTYQHDSQLNIQTRLDHSKPLKQGFSTLHDCREHQIILGGLGEMATVLCMSNIRESVILNVRI